MIGQLFNPNFKMLNRITRRVQEIFSGSPAKMICASSKIEVNDRSGPEYPRRKHFHRGYSEE